MVRNSESACWSVWFYTQPIGKAFPGRRLWRSIAELFLINNENLMTSSSEIFYNTCGIKKATRRKKPCQLAVCRTRLTSVHSRCCGPYCVIKYSLRPERAFLHRYRTVCQLNAMYMYRRYFVFECRVPRL